MKPKPRDRILHCAGAFVALSLLPFCTLAADFAIDWHTFGGGGGTSTGGSYGISGTIGQPAATASEGGGYRVEGGFWTVLVGSPTVPPLGVFNTSSNTVVVTWPASATTYTLEQSSSLMSPGWAPVGKPPIIADGLNQVVVAPPPQIMFYRLRYP